MRNLTCFLLLVVSPGLRFWNYNSSVEGTYRGVKRVLVFLDQQRLSPSEGHLLRKAPGPTKFDFGQRIRLKSAVGGGGLERIGTPHIFFGQSQPQGPVEGLVQEYEPPTLPCGFIFRFELTSTWDDRFYMGLNGLELYDQFDHVVPITNKQVHAVCVGDVSSVADLVGCQGDPRVPHKLNDGVNNTWDDSHMWLAPFQRGTTNTIYIVFEEPLTLSLVKVWNYSKTPGRGVREMQLSIDDVLVYKGHLKKAPSRPLAGGDGDFGQTLIFTNDRRVVQRERLRVYVHYKVKSCRLVPSRPPQFARHRSPNRGGS